MTTMQDLSSTVSFTPSFSFYASGNGDLVETAVRVVGEDDFEFETFPFQEESFFHFPTTTLFKRSSDVAADSKDVFYGGSWNIDQSLSSSSESCQDLEDLSPSRYYCFWSPMRSPASGGDGSKSPKSFKAPKRCRIKDFLRRSHSDGAVSTSSEAKRCSFKDLLRRSHSDGGGGGGDSSPVSSRGNGSPVLKGKNKTVSYKPESDKKRKSYLPYRQDLIGVFAGMSRFRH